MTDGLAQLELIVSHPPELHAVAKVALSKIAPSERLKRFRLYGDEA